MIEFFNDLSALEKTYFICAVGGGILFVVRMILFLVGGDADIDGDLDLDGGLDSDGAFQFLSIQTMTSFFMMFGLIGLTCTSAYGLPAIMSIGFATAAGVAMVWITERIFNFIKQFQSAGNIETENALGKEGNVYLTIPSNGIGKIQLSVQGRLREFDAISELKEDIPTGERVIVMRVVNDSQLSVSKIPTNQES